MTGFLTLLLFTTSSSTFPSSVRSFPWLWPLVSVLCRTSSVHGLSAGIHQHFVLSSFFLSLCKGNFILFLSIPSPALSCWWVSNLFLQVRSSVELLRKQSVSIWIAPPVPLLSSSSHLHLSLLASSVVLASTAPLYLTPSIHSLHRQVLFNIPPKNHFLRWLCCHNSSSIHVIFCLNCCIILSAFSLISHWSVGQKPFLLLNIKWPLIIHRVE